jgi:hypothetical protein
MRGLFARRRFRLRRALTARRFGLRRRRCGARIDSGGGPGSIVEQPRDDVKAADDDHDNRCGHRKRAQTVAELLGLPVAGRGGVLSLRRANRSCLRGTARRGDEIGLACARISNDRGLRS